MFFFSDYFGVKYDSVIITDAHEINNPFLQGVYNQLMNYMKACSDLRNDYIKNKPTQFGKFKKLKPFNYKLSSRKQTNYTRLYDRKSS